MHVLQRAGNLAFVFVNREIAAHAHKCVWLTAAVKSVELSLFNEYVFCDQAVEAGLVEGQQALAEQPESAG